MNTFERGQFPVGVTTEQWLAGEEQLTIELWYPTTDDVRGRDLDPATQDRFTPVWTTSTDQHAEPVRQAAVRDAPQHGDSGPLILFSHGFAGHRREATYLCTHLASHGYTVASADHPGSTSWEVDEALTGTATETDDADSRLTMAQRRKVDVAAMVDESSKQGLGDGGAIGVVGISLGGWTALVSPSVSDRVRAIVPMCPAGGPSPTTPNRNPFAAELDWRWPDGVTCLHLVADRDTWLPLPGQLQLLRQIPGESTMVILMDADHNHFVDDIAVSHTWYRELTQSLAETYPDDAADWSHLAASIAPIEELVDPDAASVLWQGLTVAHFDAHLRGDASARSMLDQEIQRCSASHGASTFTIRNR